MATIPAFAQDAANETKGTQTTNSGDGLASFLLGMVDNAFLRNTAAGQPHWLYNYTALFAQDDYKITPTLTLNLGFRWDVDLPRRERDGNTSDFQPNAPNPQANGLPGALVFAGKGAGRNGNRDERWANIWYKDFAPRIGFSWAPSFYRGQTVFRGGYGIYYGALTYADFGASLRDGFAATPNFGSPQGFDPAFIIDTGFPNYPKSPFLDPSQDNFGVSGGGINYIARSNGRPPMTQNWSLQVQQQLATDLILNIGYVGQHSTHLHSGYSQVNNLPTSNFALGDFLNTTITAQQTVPLPYANFPKNAIVAQALRISHSTRASTPTAVLRTWGSRPSTRLRCRWSAGSTMA